MNKPENPQGERIKEDPLEVEMANKIEEIEATQVEIRDMEGHIKYQKALIEENRKKIEMCRVKIKELKSKLKIARRALKEIRWKRQRKQDEEADSKWWQEWNK